MSMVAIPFAGDCPIELLHSSHVVHDLYEIFGPLCKIYGYVRNVEDLKNKKDLSMFFFF
jgi:hypothetical protein